MTFYGNVLAEVHHLHYGEVARHAAAAVLSRLKVSLCRIVDLGCGSGIVARILGEAGHQVTGVDISPAMVDLARCEAPAAHFAIASLYDFEIPDCDVVLGIGEPFNYLKNGAETNDLAGIFTRIRDKLSEDGLFIFDILMRDAEPFEWKSIEFGIALVELRTSVSPDHILTREILIRPESGSDVQVSETHRQKLYEPAMIDSILQHLGFTFDRTAQYADLQLRKGHYAYFCAKG